MMKAQLMFAGMALGVMATVCIALTDTPANSAGNAAPPVAVSAEYAIASSAP